ncbi:MAG TPA: glycosyltransferase [Mycobacteriales bacterium]|nr:glycosyltransferase [Mycobacteriales bacterium]
MHEVDAPPRALVSVPDTLGHLHPMVPLAAALGAAGYQVRLATGPDMAAHVRAAGFTHLPVPGRDAAPSLDRPGPGGHGPDRPADQLPRRLASLRRHAAEWRPDVVVRPWAEGAAAVLAAELGAPQVICADCLRPAPDLVTGHPVAAALARYGLSRDDLCGDLWISGYPPSLTRPGTEPLAHEHYVRPMLYDHHPAHPRPDWVDRLPDEPLVYATLGTACNWSPGVFERMVEAFAGEPYHAVIAIGPNRDPASVDVDRMPDNVRLVRYVPQSALMPRCAAVICHGGFSTVMSALSHGVPIGFVPMGTEDNGNASRCVDLGAGTCYPRMLSTPFTHLPPDPLDPQSLRRMVRRLLDGSGARARAERIRADIRALPDIDHVVALIDRMVGRRSGARAATDAR